MKRKGLETQTVYHDEVEENGERKKPNILMNARLFSASVQF